MLKISKSSRTSPRDTPGAESSSSCQSFDPKDRRSINLIASIKKHGVEKYGQVGISLKVI